VTANYLELSGIIMEINDLRERKAESREQKAESPSSFQMAPNPTAIEILNRSQQR
jgi:hypothetical protein